MTSKKKKQSIPQTFFTKKLFSKSKVRYEMFPFLVNG